MSTGDDSPSWDNIEALLQRWYEEKDRSAGRAAFEFLETELRLMTPPQVRRSWPDDLVEDALRSFLKKLVQEPLPEDVDNLRGYLKVAFRNHCIDVHRSRRRRKEKPVDEVAPGWEPSTGPEELPERATIKAEYTDRVQTALSQLELPDRIALKLVLAPQWLDNEELAWLGDGLDLSTDEVCQAAIKAPDTHALTRIFDPGDDDPDDPELRRKRMERFRKRRARAREKLKAVLEEVSR